MFTGSKNRACDRESIEQIMGRGNGGSILVHVGTNNADKEGTTAIVEKYRNVLKKTKQARVGQIILSGILPVFGNRIRGYRNSKRMAVNGMVKRLCKEEEVGYVDMWDSFVGQLCGERRNVRQRLLASEWKGGCRFCRGTVRRSCQWLGQSTIFKLVGVCQRRLKKYKRIADAKEYRETHPKQKLNASA